MNLAEEYLLRHKVRIPLVRYAQMVSVFFKESGLWHIKHMQWHPPDQHPGTYSVHTYRPVHNGIDKGRCLENVSGEIRLQWDEYEKHLLDWINISILVPKTVEEVTVASWELLLRCCDRGLIRHIHYDTLAASIDADVSPPERCRLITECLQYFSSRHSEISRLWEGDLRHHRDNHALWLAEMVKQ